MKAAVHIVPAAGVELDTTGSGILTAALRTVEALKEPVDLVMLAVPAGSANEFVAQLFENGAADGND